MYVIQHEHRLNKLYNPYCCYEIYIRNIGGRNIVNILAYRIDHNNVEVQGLDRGRGRGKNNKSLNQYYLSRYINIGVLTCMPTFIKKNSNGNHGEFSTFLCNWYSNFEINLIDNFHFSQCMFLITI